MYDIFGLIGKLLIIPGVWKHVMQLVERLFWCGMRIAVCDARMPPTFYGSGEAQGGEQSSRRAFMGDLQLGEGDCQLVGVWR